MKKWIVSVVVVIIVALICVAGITLYKYDGTTLPSEVQSGDVSNEISGEEIKTIESKEILINAMNSKQTFIAESGEEILFNEFVLPNEKTTAADKYTFVDLDKDGVEELAVLTTADYGEYIVFRYEEVSEKVYGYLIGIRAFQEVKTDGSFRGSSGADSHSYLEMEFADNKMQIKTIAVDDGMIGEYKINGEDVTEEQIDEFVNAWNQKENVEWETELIEK